MLNRMARGALPAITVEAHRAPWRAVLTVKETV